MLISFDHPVESREQSIGQFKRAFFSMMMFHSDVFLSVLILVVVWIIFQHIVMVTFIGQTMCVMALSLLSTINPNAAAMFCDCLYDHGIHPDCTQSEPNCIQETLVVNAATPHDEPTVVSSVVAAAAL